jgi:hypothetical protein
MPVTIDGAFFLIQLTIVPIGTRSVEISPCGAGELGTGFDLVGTGTGTPRWTALADAEIVDAGVAVAAVAPTVLSMAPVTIAPITPTVRTRFIFTPIVAASSPSPILAD